MILECHLKRQSVRFYKSVKNFKAVGAWLSEQIVTRSGEEFLANSAHLMMMKASALKDQSTGFKLDVVLRGWIGSSIPAPLLGTFLDPSCPSICRCNLGLRSIAELCM